MERVTNEKAIDELRGAYNQFVKSPCGADFLGKLVAYELSLTAEAMLASEPTAQAKPINKAAGIQWVRTLLQDLSKPAPRRAPLNSPRKRI